MSSSKDKNDLFDTLHVYVSKPPLEGKANRAATESLAKHFNVSKSKVSLVSGAKSKYKIFEVAL